MTQEHRTARALPPLPLDEWEDTKETLHRYCQIAGKVRMEYSPYRNHWWHVTLYVTTRGLTTGPIPYGCTTFDISLDLREKAQEGYLVANLGRPPCDEGLVRSSQALAPCTRAAAPWVLAATIFDSAMAFIDGTVVNVAQRRTMERCTHIG
jgi:hypothetical protein